MSTEPDQIRAQVAEILADLPAVDFSAGEDDIDDIAERLEAAHEVLVQALQSVEKG